MNGRATAPFLALVMPCLTASVPGPGGDAARASAALPGGPSGASGFRASGFRASSYCGFRVHDASVSPATTTWLEYC